MSAELAHQQPFHGKNSESSDSPPVLYNRPRPIDESSYSESSDSHSTYFGLPRDVQFCRKCVISNQRPSSTNEYKHTQSEQKRTIRFDADGVCDACRQTERKETAIDWKERDAQLRELCDRFRKNDGSYDCIAPGSGGKDSFYAAHMLKYKYGMHPLTVTWAPHIYTEWGWKNLQAWIHAGFDNLMFTPNGLMHRLITRLAVENLFHPFQPFILGQKGFVPKIALKYNIPLVFYGENEAEYGNPISDNSSAKRDYSYFTSANDDSISLGGTTLKTLKSEFGIHPADLDAYLPTDPQQLEDAKTEVHYLGYYLKWHPQGAYYYAVENGGFQAAPERTPGTYSKYNSIDDQIDDFHYFTTFIKFGIGRATYDASQEIRNSEITREEGVALVRKFDGEFPERFANEVFAYLSMPSKQYPRASQLFEQPMMDRDYFLALADQFRSPHLWRRDHGIWRLRHTVFGPQN